MSIRDKHTLDQLLLEKDQALVNMPHVVSSRVQSIGNGLYGIVFEVLTDNEDVRTMITNELPDVEQCFWIFTVYPTT